MTSVSIAALPNNQSARLAALAAASSLFTQPDPKRLGKKSAYIWMKCKNPSTEEQYDAFFLEDKEKDTKENEDAYRWVLVALRTAYVVVLSFKEDVSVAEALIFTILSSYQCYFLQSNARRDGDIENVIDLIVKDASAVVLTKTHKRTVSDAVAAKVRALCVIYFEEEESGSGSGSGIDNRLVATTSTSTYTPTYSPAPSTSNDPFPLANAFPTTAAAILITSAPNKKTSDDPFPLAHSFPNATAAITSIPNKKMVLSKLELREIENNIVEFRKIMCRPKEKNDNTFDPFAEAEQQHPSTVKRLDEPQQHDALGKQALSLVNLPPPPRTNVMVVASASRNTTTTVRIEAPSIQTPKKEVKEVATIETPSIQSPNKEAFYQHPDPKQDSTTTTTKLTEEVRLFRDKQHRIEADNIQTLNKERPDAFYPYPDLKQDTTATSKLKEEVLLFRNKLKCKTGSYSVIKHKPAHHQPLKQPSSSSKQTRLKYKPAHAHQPLKQPSSSSKQTQKVDMKTVVKKIELLEGIYDAEHEKAKMEQRILRIKQMLRKKKQHVPIPSSLYSITEQDGDVICGEDKAGDNARRILSEYDIITPKHHNDTSNNHKEIGGNQFKEQTNKHTNPPHPPPPPPQNKSLLYTTTHNNEILNVVSSMTNPKYIQNTKIDTEPPQPPPPPQNEYFLNTTTHNNEILNVVSSITNPKFVQKTKNDTEPPQPPPPPQNEYFLNTTTHNNEILNVVSSITNPKYIQKTKNDTEPLHPPPPPHTDNMNPNPTASTASQTATSRQPLNQQQQQHPQPQINNSKKSYGSIFLKVNNNNNHRNESTFILHEEEEVEAVFLSWSNEQESHPNNSTSSNTSLSLNTPRSYLKSKIKNATTPKHSYEEKELMLPNIHSISLNTPRSYLKSKIKNATTPKHSYEEKELMLPNIHALLDNYKHRHRNQHEQLQPQPHIQASSSSIGTSTTSSSVFNCYEEEVEEDDCHSMSALTMSSGTTTTTPLSPQPYQNHTSIRTPVENIVIQECKYNVTSQFYTEERNKSLEAQHGSFLSTFEETKKESKTFRNFVLPRFRGRRSNALHTTHSVYWL